MKNEFKVSERVLYFFIDDFSISLLLAGTGNIPEMINISAFLSADRRHPTLHPSIRPFLSLKDSSSGGYSSCQVVNVADAAVPPSLTINSA